jgi:tRNA-dihydrouridine synthase A
VLQIGGSNPVKIEMACVLAAQRGWKHINLNCGCPSDKVSGKGKFGAVCMKDPQNTRKLVAAMHSGYHKGSNMPLSDSLENDNFLEE